MPNQRHIFQIEMHDQCRHVIGEQFKLSTGTDILHVPYRGMGAALNDAIGGQVQVVYDNLPTSLELVKSGKLRPLGVSSPKRLPFLPAVPTIAPRERATLDTSRLCVSRVRT